MKPHHILTGFKGSQDGHGDGQEFVAGTTAHLSNDLARIAVGEGWARLAADDSISPNTVPEITAVVSGVLEVDERETKVVEPEETKPAKKLEKKGNK